ncbi:MAG: TetR/AcrR family transcriptional regulator [Parvibaculum sp.]|nr:TetR/AcrR family transcriptional regulator [Parvibaculum sp.]
MAAPSQSEKIPAQARSRERLAHVLLIAEQIIISDGYAALTMRKLADQCGIALGNLQYYFPTKSDLVEAVVDGICERHASSLTGRPAIKGKPEDTFRMSLHYLLEDVRKPAGSILFWEIWALAAHDKGANTAITKLHQRELDLIAFGITRLNPDLTSRTVRLRAQIIMSTIEGSSLLIGSGRPQARTPGPLIDEIIETSLALARRPE